MIETKALTSHATFRYAEAVQEMEMKRYPVVEGPVGRDDILLYIARKRASARVRSARKGNRDASNKRSREADPEDGESDLAELELRRAVLYRFP